MKLDKLMLCGYIVDYNSQQRWEQTQVGYN